MKPKSLTPVQKETELQKWGRLQAITKKRSYLIILMIMIAVIYIVDEVSTNINTSMQSSIIFDLFNITSKDVSSPVYVGAINQIGTLNVATYVFMIALPFYKSLADKFGRARFLIINTLLMGLGMLVVMFSNSIMTYFVGMAILAFVTPNDMQTIYIMETAPKQHRAKLTNIFKAIAILGISSIGLLRNIFMTDDLSSWRLVYIVPVAVAVIVSLAALLFVKETPAFIEKQISILKSDKTEEPTEKKKNVDQANGGVGAAFKFLMAHKQGRYLSIVSILCVFCTVTTFFYESIMASTMSMENVSTAIIVFPFAYAALTVISGIMSDKLGRKKVGLIFLILSTTSIFLFLFGAMNNMHPIAVGLFYGCYVGGLWSCIDTVVFIMGQESAPTNLRASVVGVLSLFVTLTAIVAMIVVTVLQNFMGLGASCAALTVPATIISMIIFTAKVGETRDVDINTVTGAEWD